MPVDQLKKEPACQFYRQLLNELSESQIFAVGGMVRDAILERRTKDFDFVVCGVDRNLLEKWLTKNGKLELVGRRFGVYKFRCNNTDDNEIPSVDIALPRTEHSSTTRQGGIRDFDVQSDPTLPIESDLARRDFTMNAMAYDLETETLVDPYNGLHDLETKKIRAVGHPEERFQEDLTRILRAIRFAAQLGFSIEEKTFKAMKKLSNKINDKRMDQGTDKMEFIVAREKIGEELSKAFMADPMRTLELLQETRVFDTIFPEIQAIIIKDAQYLKPVKRMKQSSINVTLSLLLRDLSVSDARSVLKRNGFLSLEKGSDERIIEDNVVWIIEHLKKPLTTKTVTTMPAHLFEGMFMNARGETYEEVLFALGRKTLVKSIRVRQSMMKKGPPLLSGTDVIKAGVTPGPCVREILDKIRDEQLEGKLLDRDAALKRMQKLVTNSSP